MTVYGQVEAVIIPCVATGVICSTASSDMQIKDSHYSELQSRWCHQSLCSHAVMSGLQILRMGLVSRWTPWTNHQCY